MKYLLGLALLAGLISNPEPYRYAFCQKTLQICTPDYHTTTYQCPFTQYTYTLPGPCEEKP